MITSLETKPRFNYFIGLVNFVAIFLIVWFLWYVFMHPNAVYKLYTPMYGFSLVVALLAGIVLITNISDYYPFPERPTEKLGIVPRGILLTLTAVGLMLFIVYFFFWGLIGKFAVAYFSPYSIIASGGIGAEIFVARENACTAIVYFLTAFLWMALFWNTGFGRWPWQGDSRGVVAWSRLFAVLFFSVLVYLLLFHPHVCYLFYPAQNKAGVESWWMELAGTGSAFFGLGLVLCILFWIIASELLWDGYPWKYYDSDGEGSLSRGVATFLLTFTLGVVLIYLLLQVMIYYWDEPFTGGQYTDGSDFRFLHAGEISGFFILAAFILKHYFNNFPNLGRLWVRALVRTTIAIAGGMLFYWFYYSPLATFFLGKVPGVAQPGDTSLVWTILFLSVIMIQTDFFEGWPLKKK
jgi:amino acid transporter, AAT family